MQEEKTVKVGRKHQTAGSFTSPAKTLVKCKAPTPAPPPAPVVPTTHIDYLKAWASSNTDTILQIPMDQEVLGHECTLFLNPTEQLEEVFKDGAWISQSIIQVYMRYYT